MKGKLSPLERHFIRWYKIREVKWTFKLHRWINPGCRICKSDDITYRELNDANVATGEGDLK